MSVQCLWAHPSLSSFLDGLTSFINDTLSLQVLQHWFCLSEREHLFSQDISFSPQLLHSLEELLLVLIQKLLLLFDFFHLSSFPLQLGWPLEKVNCSTFLLYEMVSDVNDLQLKVTADLKASANSGLKSTRRSWFCSSLAFLCLMASSIICWVPSVSMEYIISQTHFLSRWCQSLSSGKNMRMSSLSLACLRKSSTVRPSIYGTAATFTEDLLRYYRGSA